MGYYPCYNTHMDGKQDGNRDESLNRVLREWAVESVPPPRFREGVWRQIAADEGGVEGGFWEGLWHWVGVKLPRPAYAAGFLAVVLALGVVGGAATAQAKARRLDSEMGMRYVQSVDPFAAAKGQP